VFQHSFITDKCITLFRMKQRWKGFLEVREKVIILALDLFLKLHSLLVVWMKAQVKELELCCRECRTKKYVVPLYPFHC